MQSSQYSSFESFHICSKPACKVSVGTFAQDCVLRSLSRLVIRKLWFRYTKMRELFVIYMEGGLWPDFCTYRRVTCAGFIYSYNILEGAAK